MGIGRKIIQSGLETAAGTATAITVPLVYANYIYSPVIQNIMENPNGQQRAQALALFTVTSAFLFGLMPLYYGAKLIGKGYNTIKDVTVRNS